MTHPSSRTELKRRLCAAATIVVVLMATAMLAGCGKKGAPLPPADEPNTYPKAYPRA